VQNDRVLTVTPPERKNGGVIANLPGQTEKNGRSCTRGCRGGPRKLQMSIMPGGSFMNL